jgi:hypothetical protein
VSDPAGRCHRRYARYRRRQTCRSPSRSSESMPKPLRGARASGRGNHRHRHHAPVQRRCERHDINPATVGLCRSLDSSVS